MLPGGRGLNDNGGRGGLHSVKLSADLAELAVSPLTLLATAVCADKSVATWDVTGRGASASSPGRFIAARVATSSAACETGVGSRFMAAASLAAHPYFPPGAVVAAGKGPHLELVRRREGGGRRGGAPLPPTRLCPPPQAMLGSADKAAEAGIPLYDLRTARPGLPAKCKVYTLALHPLRPELCVAGTNIGLFVLALAPHYTAGCCAAPLLLLPPPLLPGARAGQGQGAAFLLHVTPSGSLVVSEVSVTAAAAAGGGRPPATSSVTSGGLLRSTSEGGAGPSSSSSVGASELRTLQRVLVQASGATGGLACVPLLWDTPLCRPLCAVTRASEPAPGDRILCSAREQRRLPAAAQRVGRPVSAAPGPRVCRGAPRLARRAPARLWQWPVRRRRVARAQVPRALPPAPPCCACACCGQRRGRVDVRARRVGAGA